MQCVSTVGSAELLHCVLKIPKSIRGALMKTLNNPAAVNFILKWIFFHLPSQSLLSKL